MKRINAILLTGAFTLAAPFAVEAQGILGNVLGHIPSSGAQPQPLAQVPTDPTDPTIQQDQLRTKCAAPHPVLTNSEGQSLDDPCDHIVPYGGMVAGPPNSMVAVRVEYSSDGKRGSAEVVHNVGNQTDCNVYINKELDDMKAIGLGRVSVISDSVVVNSRQPGWTWFGCVTESDYKSPAYTKFIDTPMTKQRAQSQRRFPGLNYQEPADSQRGSQIKF